MEKRKVIIDRNKTNVFAIVMLVVVGVVLAGLFRLIWGRWSDGEGRMSSGMFLLDINDFVLIALVVHELIHGLTWTRFAPRGLRSIKFGIKTETFTVNGVSFTMVTVKGGKFTMGATDEQGGDVNDKECPAHQVTVSTFSIGQTEVTQALWLAVMGTNPSYFTSAHGYTDDLQRPVERVSWYDCRIFTSRLNQITGKQFRLPTEAEWEYAARGGSLSQGYTYAGCNDLNEIAWFCDNIPSHTSETAGYGTQPVASKLPNELGLYDMSGNVWEWCFDRFDPYAKKSQKNPIGPKSGTSRVNRGGSWLESAKSCCVSGRYDCVPAYLSNDLGLRLVL